MISTAFGAGSPNANSALSKLDQVQRELQRDNLAGAQQKAIDLINFINLKNSENPLPGGQQAVLDVLAALQCYVGIQGDPITEPFDEAFVVNPSPEPQTFICETGNCGLRFPGNSVSATILVTSSVIQGLCEDGKGPLPGKLDQYCFADGAGVTFTASGPFGSVDLTLCPHPTVPPGIEARIGHGHNGNLSIADPIQGFLSCPAAGPEPTLQRSERTGTLSRKRNGTTTEVATLDDCSFCSRGVGGSAINFSDFAIVDGNLYGSGAGGSRINFEREDGLAFYHDATPCPTTLPQDTHVAAHCRPALTITTALGTAMEGVPVTFTAAGPGSVINPWGWTTNACGFAGNPLIVPTFGDGDLVFNEPNEGNSTVCWKVGTPGTHTVTAVPDFGGDAPEGVVFLSSVPTGAGNAWQWTITVNHTFTTLCQYIKTGGIVTDPKLGESLCQKLAAAEASEVKGDTKGKVRNLDSFISQVQAQTGKNIPNAADAQYLIDQANYCKTNACAG